VPRVSERGGTQPLGAFPEPAHSGREYTSRREGAHWSLEIAPTPQPPAAETAVAADRDLHLRPGGAEPPHQQLEHGAGVLAGVDIAGAEVGDEQLIAAENV